jgi:asparagine N-glycosylation enzyme membrane subunit Stt3
MKFSDPFGRKERRRQIAYETVRDAMIQAGIDTPEAAQEIIRKTKDRSMKFLGAGLAVFLLAIWLVPKAMIVTFFLAFVLVFGIVKSTISGTRLIQRYIDEELK